MSCADPAAQVSSSISNRAIRLLCAVLLTFGIAGAAAAQTIDVEFDEEVDFTQFKTFAVREGHLKSRAPALNSELTRKRIRTEIERALTAKGLSSATGQADLNVSFQFGSVRGADVRTFPAGARGRATRVVKVPQSDGTLVIDLVSSSTGALVWRGIASESEPNPSKLADKLDNMVKKAIDKYPPKKGK